MVEKGNNKCEFVFDIMQDVFAYVSLSTVW